jgi:low temperature requirement protein LtrA
MVDRPVEREQRVTPLELFFDLVVVFAITQVTELMSNDLVAGRRGTDCSSSRRSGGCRPVMPG